MHVGTYVIRDSHLRKRFKDRRPHQLFAFSVVYYVTGWNRLEPSFHAAPTRYHRSFAINPLEHSPEITPAGSTSLRFHSKPSIFGGAFPRIFCVTVPSLTFPSNYFMHYHSYTVHE